MVEWGRNVTRMNKTQNAQSWWESQKEGDWQEDNIKVYLREIGWGGTHMDWIYVTQDGDQWWTLANIIMNLWAVQNAGTFSST